MYLPGITSEGVGEIAIAVECPGRSVRGQLALFEAEIRSILEGQRPHLVHVLYFDTAIQKIEEYQAGQPVSLFPVEEAEQISGRASSGCKLKASSRRRWCFSLICAEHFRAKRRSIRCLKQNPARILWIGGSDGVGVTRKIRQPCTSLIVRTSDGHLATCASVLDEKLSRGRRPRANRVQRDPKLVYTLPAA